jgi:hypothetical protein
MIIYTVKSDTKSTNKIENHSGKENEGSKEEQ